MPKKTIAVISVVAIVLLMAIQTRAANDSAALELYFFGSATCGECMELKNTLLQPLERELGDRLKITYHDTDDGASLELATRLEKQFNVTKPSPQELFFPDTALLGFDAIKASARAFIEERLNDPQGKKSITATEPAGSVDDALRERFGMFTFIGVFTAALVDAVNPCAIATMIFLVSFLATQKRRKSEILVTGLSFTAAVFVTYFLLGLGAFKAITLLEQYYWVSLGIKWFAVLFAGTIGIISLVDAFRFKKSGDAGDIMNKLPESVRKRINTIIKTKMTGRNLFIGALITGFLVTLLEAVCTGQVYLPTIILMTRSSDGELKLIGWLYLVMYNFIFVLPLLIVMIAAYYGMTWKKLSQITQKNLTLLKILVGVVLLGLATFLALA